MIDIKDINHMVILASAWVMTNISLILAIVIMILQIYILVLKIKKMRSSDRIESSRE